MPDSRKPSPEDLEATADLLTRVRRGDDRARDTLVRRFLPILRRWAHGRLRGPARALAETDDLVQITLIQALQHVDRFEPRREGAFLAYLRQILLNAVRQEARSAARRPSGQPLAEIVVDPAPVVEAVGRETMQAYEDALERLPALQREAVILRVEFGYSHREIAEAIGSPSANAARMTVSRALVRIAEIMDDSEARGRS
jgi:RNA polymerase sigma-70 factor (ECF subfamily)